MINLIFNLQNLAIFFKTVIGGIVGYFTNDLAIQMLFKKKFGMGGVVEKTRDEFIENATDLIEEDVVNQKVLKEKLETNEFRTLLEHFIHQYLNQQIPDQIAENIKISHIRKSNQSFDAFINQLNLDSELLLKDFLKNCWEEIPGELLLSKQLLTKSLDQLIPFLLQQTEIIELFEKLLDHLFQHLKTQTPGHYFKSKPYQAIINYLITQLKDALKKPSSEVSKRLNQAIDSFITSIQPQQNISILIDYIYEKTWVEIINYQQFNRLFKEIQKNFMSFFSSPSGQNTTLSFAQSLLKTIKKSNNNLFDLVPDQLSIQFESFIYQRLVEIIKSVTLWIEDRRIEIELMVNQSISDQNMVAKIVYSIGISLAEMFNVVNIIKDYVNGKIDIDQLAEQQSRAFITALKQYSIQDIFKKLESEQIITEKQLAAVFQKTIFTLISSLNPELFHFFLTDKPDKIIPKALLAQKIVTLFQSHLPPFIHNIITSDNQLTVNAYRNLKYRLLILFKKPLKRILPDSLPASWLGLINQSLFKMIENYRKTISAQVNEKIQSEIANKSLDAIIPFNKRFFTLFHNKLIQLFFDFKSSFLSHYLKDLWLRLGDFKLNLSLVNQIQMAISSHFHRFTRGGIKKISKSNLQSLSLKELSSVVENFMGKELKPITRFGAGLGLLAGFGMSVLPGIEQLAGKFNIDSRLLVFSFAGLIFGFIGWGTNWLALKMIFRPYLPWYILGYTMPLTPGVIAKNKNRFAGKMGEFVQENLLNDSSIEKLFETNQDVIRGSFQKAIQENDYQLLNDIIQKNRSEISDQLAKLGAKFLSSQQFQKTDFFSIITTYFKTFEPLIESIDAESKIRQIISDQQLKIIQPHLNSLLNEEKFSQQRLSDLLHHLPEKELTNTLTQFLSSYIGPATSQVFSHKTFLNISGQLDVILEKFSTKPLNSLLTKKSIKQVQSQLFSLILSILENPNQRQFVLDYLKSKITAELNPDKKINDLLDGKITDFLFQKIDRVTHFFVNLALRYFKKNKEKIAASIYDMLIEKSDFLARQAIRFSKDDLYNAIYDIFQIKLPDFVETHELSLQELVREQLRVVGDTKIGHIGDIIDHDKIAQFIDLCLSNRLLVKDSKKLIDAFIIHLFQFDIAYFLRLIHLDSFQNIAVQFKDKISILLENIKRNIRDNQTELVKNTGSFASATVMELIQKINIEDIKTSMTVPEYQKTIHVLSKVIIEQAIQFKLTSKFTGTFFNISEKISIKQILDQSSLNQSFTSIFHFILNNKALENHLQQMLSQLTKSLLNQFNNIVHQETREDLLNIALKGLMAGFKSNLLNILNTIHFKQIVMDQITKMHPAKIETMFNKFAGSYFPKLINYGFGFGFVFGLSMDVFYYFTVLLLSL